MGVLLFNYALNSNINNKTPICLIHLICLILVQTPHKHRIMKFSFYLLLLNGPALSASAQQWLSEQRPLDRRWQIQSSVKVKEDGKVPVFWEDNDFTLLPGEKRVINGYVHTKDLRRQTAVVSLSGWNIMPVKQ